MQLLHLEKKSKKYDWLLIAFIGAMLVSSLMNLKYGYSENIKLIMWQLIFFFMIYQFGKDYSSNFFSKYLPGYFHWYGF